MLTKKVPDDFEHQFGIDFMRDIALGKKLKH